MNVADGDADDDCHDDDYDDRTPRLLRGQLRFINLRIG
jgi:hypothetical protein